MYKLLKQTEMRPWPISVAFCQEILTAEMWINWIVYDWLPKLNLRAKWLDIMQQHHKPHLYLSLASSILSEVFLPSSTLISISAAVFLVVSKLMTSAESLRISGPAEDNRLRRSSSRVLSVILKSFCCLVSPARRASKSGRSAFTTSPRSCSSKLNRNVGI